MGLVASWLFFILLFCFYLKPESGVNLTDILTPPKIKICICVYIEKTNHSYKNLSHLLLR